MVQITFQPLRGKCIGILKMLLTIIPTTPYPNPFLYSSRLIYDVSVLGSHCVSDSQPWFQLTLFSLN